MSEQRACQPIEFAFFQALPTYTIKTYKDLIRQFLDKEDLLYADTFNLYVVFREMSYTKVQLSDIFCEKLHKGMIVAYSNPDALKELGRHAFDEYWHIAGDPAFWPGGDIRMKNLFPHPKVVEKWQESNKEKIIDCEPKLWEFREALVKP